MWIILKKKLKGKMKIKTTQLEQLLTTIKKLKKEMRQFRKDQNELKKQIESLHVRRLLENFRYYYAQKYAVKFKKFNNNGRYIRWRAFLESVLKEESKSNRKLIKYTIETYRYNSECIHKKMNISDLREIIKNTRSDEVKRIAKIVKDNF